MHPEPKELTELPNEMLVAIATHLKPIDKATLMLVSKRFAGIGKVAMKADRINFLNEAIHKLENLKERLGKFFELAIRCKAEGIYILPSDYFAKKADWPPLKAALAQITEQARKFHPNDDEKSLHARVIGLVDELNIREKRITKLMGKYGR